MMFKWEEIERITSRPYLEDEIKGAHCRSCVWNEVCKCGCCGPRKGGVIGCKKGHPVWPKECGDYLGPGSSLEEIINALEGCQTGYDQDHMLGKFARNFWANSSSLKDREGEFEKLALLFALTVIEYTPWDPHPAGGRYQRSSVGPCFSSFFQVGEGTVKKTELDLPDKRLEWFHFANSALARVKSCGQKKNPESYLKWAKFALKYLLALAMGLKDEELTRSVVKLEGCLQDQPRHPLGRYPERYLADSIALAEKVLGRDLEE